MRKYFFRIFGYVILIAVIAGMGIAIGLQQKRIGTLKNHVSEQKEAIRYLKNENNELRKLKTYSFNFDCKLQVTDKSKTTLYGRNNKGQMIAPNVKTYELKIDSTNFMMSVLP